jgi:integrase
VRGLHAKDRQRRHVKIHSTLEKWLDLDGDLPAKNLRKRWARVRLKSGLVKEVDGKLEGWEPDCLRHTFASAWLAMHGAESTIQQLGHGDYDMLFGHYRTLMTKEQAEKIFSLTPDAVSKS